jgi:hypothetical protein
MNLLRVSAVCLLGLVFLSGCATAPVSLAGNYSLRAPDGATSTVEVRALRDQEYYLRAPGQPVSGVYQFASGELRITKPDNPRMSGFTWKKNADGSLVLVAEPPVPVSGTRLMSATLTRTN